MGFEQMTTEELLKHAFSINTHSQELKKRLNHYFKTRTYLQSETFGDYLVHNLDEDFYPLRAYKIFKLKEGVIDRKYIAIMK